MPSIFTIVNAALKSDTDPLLTDILQLPDRTYGIFDAAATVLLLALPVALAAEVVLEAAEVVLEAAEVALLELEALVEDVDVEDDAFGVLNTRLAIVPFALNVLPDWPEALLPALVVLVIFVELAAEVFAG